MGDYDKMAAALLAAVGGSDEEGMGPSVWLDTGFVPLNMAISNLPDGGLPSGRIVEIFGPPSSGKTAIATAAMAAAQQMGGIAAFNDHERSFVAKQAQSLGLNLTPGRFLYKKPRTFEESVELFIKGVRAIRESKLINEKAPICWVFDSLACMIPGQKLEKGASALNMNDTTALARLTSAVFPTISLICEEYNVCAIFLNQVRTKPGVVYGDPTTSPGGDAPKFYASVRIQLGASKLSKGEGVNAVVVGQEVTARCVKNKVNRPFLKAKWRFLFRDDGSGYFDRAGSLITFAIEKGALTLTGSRVTWTDGKTYFPTVLAKKIDDEGLLPELTALLVKKGVEVEVDAEAEALAAAS